ncbi:hypothetical protein D3C86_1408430 [compost metagenome]
MDLVGIDLQTRGCAGGIDAVESSYIRFGSAVQFIAFDQVVFSAIGIDAIEMVVLNKVVFYNVVVAGTGNGHSVIRASCNCIAQDFIIIDIAVAAVNTCACRRGQRTGEYKTGRIGQGCTGY